MDHSMQEAECGLGPRKSGKKWGAVYGGNLFGGRSPEWGAEWAGPCRLVGGAVVGQGPDHSGGRG